MYVGTRDDPTLPFAKLRKFHYSSTCTTFVFSCFYLFVFTSISNITVRADFVMGQLCYVQSGFGCLALFILFRVLARNFKTCVRDSLLGIIWRPRMKNMRTGIRI